MIIMKKLLLVAIILMSIVLILGISWGKLFKKELPKMNMVLSWLSEIIR